MNLITGTYYQKFSNLKNNIYTSRKINIKSKKKILFSIIIPTYNSSKFIRKCISSVVNYKYNFNYEILVIDDCSLDNTISYVTRISKSFKQIKIFKTKKNSGPGITRNIGARNSKGEFLIFLDSDDTLVPGSLLNLSKIIKKNKDIKIIINNSLRNKPPYNNNYLFELFKFKKIETKVFLKKCIETNTHIDEVWKLVIRKSFLEKNNISFPSMHIGEDQCFILKIFEYSKFIYLNKKYHIKHSYNNNGLSQKIGNFACVSYALAVKFLSTIKSNKNYFNNYLRFKIKSLQILSFLHFILLDNKKKFEIIKDLENQKINTKSFITKIKSLKNKIFFSLNEYNLKSKNMDFFVYCADIYGISFYEMIKKKCKIKNLIDDNKKINQKNKLSLKIKNFNLINFSKKKQNVFFVCIKDLNKFEKIKNRINNSKLINPVVKRIDF